MPSMHFSGELRQSQTQTLTPQMRQGLHLLSMSLPELRTELHREMGLNPVIEDVESTLESRTVSEKEHESDIEERQHENDYPDDDALPDPSWEADADAIERRQKFFDSQTREETLEEHLMSQIEMSDIDPKDIPLADMLIGELDDSGYFMGSIPDMMMATGESEAHIRAVLRKLTTLDPLGCGATSIEECLIAQIEKLDGSPYRDEVREIIERKHLADVAEGKFDIIAKDLGTAPDRLPDVLAALRSLEPRPGRPFSRMGKSVAYVNPEVHALKNADGRWIAQVDDRSIPEIRVSSHYLKMLEDPKCAPEVKAYIRERIAAAQTLADSVEHREDTIRNIAQAIFDAQPGFFEEGLKGLKPLTMNEIADKVGVHHTTVSRTVRDKYASTPRGTVELRKFFTSGYITESGEAVSKDTVLERLRDLIDGEEKSAPLSDDKLAAALKKEGFAIARRTVAKYRIKLGIPGASERRSQ